MLNVPKYLLPLVHAYENNSDTDTAVQMKKYMRNQFDFFGIVSPVRKEVYKEFISKNGLIPPCDKEEIVRWCWDAPQREYQMFAMEFLGKSAKKEGVHVLDIYEYMIITKPWWDTVDYIAANLVGTYFKNFPEHIPEITKRWMESGNIWLQRTCLLFQLKYKSNLNTKLLESFIITLSKSNEFFIRKAIGWILREYSKTNSDYVISFVANHKLSNLSKREALLWMTRKGII